MVNFKRFKNKKLSNAEKKIMKFFLKVFAVMKKAVSLQPKSQDSTKSHAEHLTELI
jgi:hypothetical protein